MMARGSLCVTRLLRGHLLDKSPEVGQINHESGQKCFELGQSSRAGSVRHKSGSSRRRNRRGELIEVHLEGGEMEAFAVKTLEETIHKMAVKRAAPVWLPFRPGMSYWVPPPAKLGDIIEVAINSKLSHEDLQLFSTAKRGWPSTAYYIQDESSQTVETIADTNEKSEEEEEG
ncbi:uncharacterized protein LOC131075823 [Cryptomeria japonica]|uniref:uncharacterized protein LOC131075823 n=1 Tax=Cryptomeria japonica TaxID=3369 RepID=UPI0025ACB44B|nr:uncharacterized protein LOC131075823 [Cryptomeria japonica]